MCACRPSAPLHTVFQRSCRPLAGQSPDVQRPRLPGGPPSEKKSPRPSMCFSCPSFHRSLSRTQPDFSGVKFRRRGADTAVAAAE